MPNVSEPSNPSSKCPVSPSKSILAKTSKKHKSDDSDPIWFNCCLCVCVMSYWISICWWGVMPIRDGGIKHGMNFLFMFDKNKLFCFPIFSRAHRLHYLSIGDEIVNKNWTMSMVMMSKELWRRWRLLSRMPKSAGPSTLLVNTSRTCQIHCVFSLHSFLLPIFFHNGQNVKWSLLATD